jgi:hypothetical protein
MHDNAAKNNKDMSIVIPHGSIKGVEIVKSNNYNYARMGAKLGDNVFVSVSYEWQGDIPDQVMSLMDYVKSGESKASFNKEEFVALQKRLREVK